MHVDAKLNHGLLELNSEWVPSCEDNSVCKHLCILSGVGSRPAPDNSLHVIQATQRELRRNAAEDEAGLSKRSEYLILCPYVNYSREYESSIVGSIT